jgi:hypothetical protein
MTIRTIEDLYTSGEIASKDMHVIDAALSKDFIKWAASADGKIVGIERRESHDWVYQSHVPLELRA